MNKKITKLERKIKQLKKYDVRRLFTEDSLNLTAISWIAREESTALELKEVAKILLNNEIIINFINKAE